MRQPEESSDADVDEDSDEEASESTGGGWFGRMGGVLSSLGGRLKDSTRYISSTSQMVG
jgi:hypothetical protein